MFKKNSTPTTTTTTTTTTASANGSSSDEIAPPSLQQEDTATESNVVTQSSTTTEEVVLAVQPCVVVHNAENPHPAQQQQQQLEGDETRKNFVPTKRLVGVLLLILVALILVVTSVLLVIKKKHQQRQHEQIHSTTSKSITTFQKDKKAYFDHVLTLLLETYNLPMDSFTALTSDPSSPQQLALNWLVYQDSFLLQQHHFVKNSSGSSEDEDFEEEDVLALLNQQLLQRYAVAVLYFGTGGRDFWTVKEWLKVTESECYYEGIKCQYLDVDNANEVEQEDADDTIDVDIDRDPHRQLSQQRNPRLSIQTVTEIDLSQFALSGLLPPDISLLTGVTFLNLQNNRLRGSIPFELFVSLTNLKDIYLDRNEFNFGLYGDLSQMTKLETLLLSHNKLTGLLPRKIPDSLITFVVDANSFSGPIHETIRSWTMNSQERTEDNTTITMNGPNERRHPLTSLILTDNMLTGTIPPEISFYSLRWFGIANSKISGEVPNEIWKGCTNLATFSSSRSFISGTLPSTELQHLTKLNLLLFESTKIAGTIPSEIGYLSDSLRVFRAGFSELSGTIPTEFGSLTKLETMSLDHTKLSGSIPAAFCQKVDNPTKYFPPTFHIDCPRVTCDCCDCA